MEQYGYVRVSTKDQNEERQIVALREFGIKDECIYILIKKAEKISIENSIKNSFEK